MRMRMDRETLLEEEPALAAEERNFVEKDASAEGASPASPATPISSVAPSPSSFWADEQEPFLVHRLARSGGFWGQEVGGSPGKPAQLFMPGFLPFFHS